MSQSTYFVQECPTCGRSLQVRVQYLGRDVVCQHCMARFQASDPASGKVPESSSGLELLSRVERLLREADTVRARVH